VRRGVVFGALGRALLGLGTLILLFVAYQLWGTALVESHSQAVLRTEFNRELHKAHLKTTTPTSTPVTPGGKVDPAPTTASPAEGMPVGVIEIPKIGLNKVIIEGTGTTDLRQGPGHYMGTSLPGQAGNAAIAGHRTTYGAPFYNLNTLGRGDDIVVTTTQGVFTYQVVRSFTVPCGGTSCNDPADSDVLTTSTTPELTLTTCDPPYEAVRRLIVQSDLAAAQLNAAAPTTSTTVPSRPRPRAESDALAGDQGDWAPALWWGAALVAALVAVWLVARRRARWLRRLLYGVGGVGVLAVLFFFFGAVSPLLPASF
jgi:sortase A